MNTAYRSIWSECSQSWVAISEVAATGGMRAGAARAARRHPTALAAALALALPGLALAQSIDTKVPVVVFPGALATIDMRAVNSAAPAADDGILITRVTAFNSNPGATRDGMMVYLVSPTTVGSRTYAPGLYAWNNASGQWLNSGLSTVMVNGANAAAASGINAVAIGSGANAFGFVGVSIGSGAGAGADIGDGNTYVGMNAGRAQTSNAYNTVVGAESGENTSGARNTALGYVAGSQVTGNQNNALGNGAGFRVIGDRNSAIGSQAGNYVSGADNFAAGLNAGSGTSTTALAVSNTISIGRDAVARSSNSIAMGQSVTTGTTGQNVAIGSGGTTANSGTAAGGAVAIGRDVRAFGNGAIAIGDPTYVSGEGAVGLGANNVANSDGTNSASAANQARGVVAIGNQNVAIGQGSVAIGNQSRAGAAGAVALGDQATASYAGSVALGSGSTTGAAAPTGSAFATGAAAPASEVSVGSAAAQRRITNVSAGSAATDAVNVGQLQAVTNNINSFMGQSVFNPATGAAVAPTFTVQGTNYSNVTTALAAVDTSITTASNKWVAGNPAAYVAPTATGANATAIGSGASSTGANSVALGNASTDGGRANVVSVGAVGAERQVTNVAAATQTTDAVNLGQVRSLATALGGGASYDAAGNLVAPAYNLTNVAADGSTTAGSYNNVGAALGSLNSSVSNLNTTVNGIVAGAGIKYFHTNSTLTDSQATGTNSSAIGPESQAGGANALAAGRGAQANGADSLAMGLNSTASGTRALANGAGAQATTTDAIAIGSSAQAAGTGAIAVGQGSQALTTGGIGLGAGSVANRAGLGGATELFSGTAVASTQGALSIGSTGAERQITNVAGGTQATDAVNVRQLQAVQSGSVQYALNADSSTNYSRINLGNGVAGGTTLSNVAAGVAGTDAVNVNQLNNAQAQFSSGQAATNARIDALGNRVEDVAKTAYAGIASVMAVQLPAGSVPGKTVMRIGTATYGGEGAVGMSFRRTSSSNLWSITGGLGLSRGGPAATIGAEWVLN